MSAARKYRPRFRKSNPLPFQMRPRPAHRKVQVHTTPPELRVKGRKPEFWDLSMG